ncbi:MAG TPA: adenylate/guanylate cyclase domain-containing protein [Acidimicrobiia bacterium]
MAPRDLPVGTVTFLFSDIEGSTRMLQELGDAFRPVLEQHNRIVHQACEDNRGRIVKNEGDGFFVAFQSAVDAVACAVEIQRQLGGDSWSEAERVRVRIGIHTGEGRFGGSDYVGIDVHRAARIGDSGHGGQILLSEATARLTEYSLPPGTRLQDLGTHRLRDLTHEEHIYQLDVDGTPNQFPPLRTMSATKGNLPIRDLDLVGRQHEKEAVIEALEGSRLVTLTGPGGVGKTTLALKVAEELAPEYEDGVWLVEVSRVPEENLLPAAIARQLHITESPLTSVTDTLISRLAKARSLLILDGCEHLIDAVAKLADQLLQETAELKILATTREWMSIREEHLVQLSPLAVPGPEARTVEAIAAYDSVALFVSRAKLVQASFELTPLNAGLVAEVCRRLDGIPLAIELAAARLKVLSVGQLVDRLDQQFALLAGTARDLPPHQQTLETTLDWSFDFLGSAERALFTRLSVFNGGFTLEAAESVCAGGVVVREHVMNLLARLVETSLVMASDTDPIRYRLLEPISHYARMRLDEGEAETLRSRHAAYFLALAEAGDNQILDIEQNVWADRLERDRYNLRAALEWLHESGRAEEAMAMAGALRWFWVIKREVSDGTKWLERTLAHREGVDPAVVARALNGAGLLASRRLAFDEAQTALTEAMEIYHKLGDRQGEARQAYQLMATAWLRDDLEEATRLAPEAERLTREVGDTWMLAWTLAVWGTMERLQGNLGEARSRMMESHQLFLDHAGVLDIGWSALRLGALARDEGDYIEATSRYTEGRALLVIAGDSLGLAHADAGLGAMAWLAGDHDYALELYRSALEGFTLYEEAANNLFELKTMIQSNPTTDELQRVVEQNRGRAELTDDKRGPRAALAEYLYHMGKTAFRHDQIERAQNALRESLVLSHGAKDMRGVAIAVAGLAVCAQARGQEEVAARLFGLADWVASENRVAVWPPPEESDYATVVGATQAALGSIEFAHATVEGEGMSIEEALDLVGKS